VFRIIDKALPAVEMFVDLGCGDGFLSKAILVRYPDARGLLVDASAPNLIRNRLDKSDNILAPVSAQCDWLSSIGYEDVDCFFKCFELAIFGGRKP
jgi:16S rRNA G1207 methylase RsmC